MNAKTYRQIARSLNHQIEIVYPLRRDGDQLKPFPTIYWLQPGELHRAVADLERRGHIAELERRIVNDEDFRGAVHADHERYRDQRWAMLRVEDRALLEVSPSLMRSFRGGVGGVADFDHVKCLHAHVAHELADQNAIGRAVLDIIEQNHDPGLVA